VEQRLEKKRERRRHRRRRSSQEERGEAKEATESSKAEEAKEISKATEMHAAEETPSTSSMFSRLFPPPPTLISEKLGKTREKNVDSMERDVLSEPFEESGRKKHETKEFVEENFEIPLAWKCLAFRLT
jgi:hypothetical protein